MAELVPATTGAILPATGATPLDRARGLIAQPGIRRMLPWFVGAAGLGLAALTFAAMAPAPQRVLYATLADGERAEVVAALEQAGIAYQIDPATGAMTVAEDELYRARMTVASQGALALPETGAQLIDALPMGASRTLEGDRLRAAQERELQLTIMEIDGVEAVRVHLAKAEKSVFVRENGDPTASVMLRLARGRSLSQPQVSAIANLVAASVVGLTPDRVRIVDQHGSLLSDPADPQLDGLDLQARTEAKLREQVVQLLTPIVGAEAFSTEVQAVLDMNELTSARESYDREGAVRTESTSETTTMDSRAAGIPGATSNMPPLPPEAEQRAPLGTEADAAAQRNGASNASRTFELGREVSVTSNRPGQVARVSVAVAIDSAALGNNAQAEIARIEELVSAAVGADPQRGDNVAVVARRFQPQQMDEPAFWETPWFATILRNVVALIGVLLVLLLLVRPLLKALTQRLAPPKAEAAENAADGAAGAQGGEAREPAPADEEPSALPANPAVTPELTEQIALARRIAREQPDDALQALRRMLREQQTAPADDDEKAEAA